jgi:hypothetical protein
MKMIVDFRFSFQIVQRAILEFDDRLPQLLQYGFLDIAARRLYNLRLKHLA